jgi:hypothetical protein
MSLKPILATIFGWIKREIVMSSIVTVTHKDQSKSGKPRVFFGGKNNWQDAYYLGNDVTSVPEIGQTIEIDASSRTFPNARAPTWFINKWRLANGSAQTPVAQPYMAIPNSQAKPYPGWDIPTGDLSRFVSNVIGSAIAAGLIKAPTDIAPWVAASYEAGNALRSGKVEHFSDPVPKFVEPDSVDTQGHGSDDEDYDSSVPF